jgi:hypothetical protein
MEPSALPAVTGRPCRAPRVGRTAPESAEPQDERLARETLRRAFELLEGPGSSELGEELPLLPGSDEGDDVVSPQVRQGRARENTRGSGEENSHSSRKRRAHSADRDVRPLRP